MNSLSKPLVTTIAVNIEITMPAKRVIAKFLIGAGLNGNSIIIAAMMVVTLESIIAVKALE